MNSLTAMDIVVLLLVGGGALFGFGRGLVHEVLTLGAWIAAILAVRLFHAPATEWLTGPVGTAGGAAVLAFALLFGVVFALGKWAARSLGEKSRRSFVGGFDRGLGAGFGAIKGLLLATVGFMLVTLLYDIGNGGDAPRPKWMTDSRTYPALSATGAALSGIIDERRRGRRAEEKEAADGASAAP